MAQQADANRAELTRRIQTLLDREGAVTVEVEDYLIESVMSGPALWVYRRGVGTRYVENWKCVYSSEQNGFEVTPEDDRDIADALAVLRRRMVLDDLAEA